MSHRTHRALILSIGLLLTACGDEADPSTDASVSPRTDASSSTPDAGASDVGEDAGTSPVLPPGTATSTGSFGGTRFAPRSAVYFFDSDPRRGDLLIVAMADVPDVCGLLDTDQLTIEIFEPFIGVPGASLLTWNVVGRDASGAGGTIEPGTIPFAILPFEGASPRPPPAGGDYGYPLLTRTTPECVSAGYQYDVRSTQAELVIESFSSTTAVVRGRYTITEAGASGSTTLTGAFAAVPCAAGRKGRVCR